jgi:hypothetical protein
VTKCKSILKPATLSLPTQNSVPDSELTREGAGDINSV